MQRSSHFEILVSGVVVPPPHARGAQSKLPFGVGLLQELAARTSASALAARLGREAGFRRSGKQCAAVRKTPTRARTPRSGPAKLPRITEIMAASTLRPGRQTSRRESPKERGKHHCQIKGGVCDARARIGCSRRRTSAAATTFNARKEITNLDGGLMGLIPPSYCIVWNKAKEKCGGSPLAAPTGQPQTAAARCELTRQMTELCSIDVLRDVPRGVQFQPERSLSRGGSWPWISHQR